MQGRNHMHQFLVAWSYISLNVHNVTDQLPKLNSMLALSRLPTQRSSLIRVGAQPAIQVVASQLGSNMECMGEANISVLESRRMDPHKLRITSRHFDALGFMGVMDCRMSNVASICRRHPSAKVECGRLLRQCTGISEAWKRKYL